MRPRSRQIRDGKEEGYLDTGSGHVGGLEMGGYLDAITDLGLRVDGTPGNNTAILQPYLLGNNGRTPIFFPPGTYLFDSQSSLSPSSFFLINLGVSMYGSGHGSTIFTTNSDAPVPLLLLMQTLGGTTIQGISFSRFVVAQPKGSAIAIDSGPPVISLRDLMVSGNSDIGLEIRGASGLKADNCWFQGQSEGVKIKKQSFIGEVVLDSCVIGTYKNSPTTIGLCYEGIDAGNLLDAALRIQNCHIGTSGGGRAVLAKHAQNLWLVQNVLEGAGAGGGAQVNLQNCGNCHVKDNTWSGDLPVGQDAFLVDNQLGGGELEIIGNRIMGKFRSGMVFNGLGWSNLLIANNIIVHTHADDIGLYDGIAVIDPQANGILVAGNIVRRFNAGVRVAASVSDRIIEHNILADNVIPVA